MITVTLYYHQLDQDYEKITTDLEALSVQIPHTLVKIDIETDPVFLEKYRHQVPFIKVGPFTKHYPFTRDELRVTLNAAADREQDLISSGDKSFQTRKDKGHTFTGSDRFTLWFSGSYMWIINLMVFIFVAIPFMAPVFLRMGYTLPAKIIYGIYSPLCHQYAFRSYFLFGKQWIYPRELAGVNHLITYEEVVGHEDINVFEARRYVGDNEFGFKVAMCERDIAIWSFLWLAGVIFTFSGRHIKPYPWFIAVWVIVGLVPMGIDGVSQLPGILVASGFEWLPIRESTPFLRTLTGGLFGLTTGLYIYPIIEETMRETKSILLQKRVIAEQEKTSTKKQ